VVHEKSLECHKYERSMVKRNIGTYTSTQIIEILLIVSIIQINNSDYSETHETSASLIELTTCCNPLEPSLLAETSSHATDRDIVPVKHIGGHEGLFQQGSNNPPHKSL